MQPGSVAPISYDGFPETRGFWGGNLPHWDVRGRPIFLTLHVRGAIPRQGIERICNEAANLRDKGDSDYTRKLKLIFKEMETWLDRADHATSLTQPGMTAMLRDAIERRSASQILDRAKHKLWQDEWFDHWSRSAGGADSNTP